MLSLNISVIENHHHIYILYLFFLFYSKKISKFCTSKFPVLVLSLLSLFFFTKPPDSKATLATDNSHVGRAILHCHKNTLVRTLKSDFYNIYILPVIHVLCTVFVSFIATCISITFVAQFVFSNLFLYSVTTSISGPTWYK